MASGPAYEGQRSHNQLCCRPAVNVWRRLPAATMNSSCDPGQTRTPQTQEKTVTAPGTSQGGGEGGGGQVQSIFHLEPSVFLFFCREAHFIQLFLKYSTF